MKNALKNSSTEELSRSDKVESRPARVPRGAGGILAVSESILDEIKAAGCEARWCLDDNQGNISKYEAAYWDIYKDANGKSIKRPAGGGKTHILMMLKKEYAEEDRALKRKRNSVTLNDTAKLDRDGDAPEYIPDGREYVVSSDL